MDSTLLITNYSTKQLNEYKIALARTMKLSHVDDFQMHVRTRKNKNGVYRKLTICVGKKSVTVVLVDLPLVPIRDIQLFIDLNERAEKMMFREEWVYGLKDKEALEQVIGDTYQEFFGFVPYPTVVDKAAHFWFKIATKQVFFNGNKRTALLVGILFLNLNFFDIPDIKPEDFYEISLKLANKEMSFKQLKAYLLKHIVISIELMNQFLDTVKQTETSKIVDKSPENK